ncbi:MAG TPA: type 4a pilus biogenesis protein PilO [Candidatus Acidoferrales bacterium]|nr:type 4a pilus biogenesis protein PilO [Candidatus Acidoferrales bacterium]
MATSFRELPAPAQAVIFLALAGVIILAGEFVPGLPIQQVRLDRDNAVKQLDQLHKDVQALQVFERQSGQLRADIDAMQKELETLKTIVPDEKQVDEFIKALNDSARASSVSLRRLTAKPIAPKDYFYEVPFDVDVDGPYYQVMDFFTRLGHLSRIINVGDLEIGNPQNARRGGSFVLRPGTTVIGSFTATTYFTGGPGGPPKTDQSKPGAVRR